MAQNKNSDEPQGYEDTSELNDMAVFSIVVEIFN